MKDVDIKHRSPGVPKNALTIDVEDYYMVSAFEDVVRFEDWHRYESRIEGNTYRILDLLDQYGVKATFFILGWVAERHPGLVRHIHSAGHEVACHGYGHRLISSMTPEQFRSDVRLAKGILEEITGNPVIGYRAASYSIVKETLWALDILIEEGFIYDSSIFPVHHDRYGYPEFSRFPVIIGRDGVGEILEIPPSTIRIINKNIPIAGGGYLRLFPIQFIKWGLSRLNEKEGKPVIVYFHPWEIDPSQPVLSGGLRSILRHYVNLHGMEDKVDQILRSFSFMTIKKLFGLDKEGSSQESVAHVGANSA